MQNPTCDPAEEGFVEGARHGERSGYTHDGCKASGCRAANTRYHHELAARKRKEAKEDPSLIPHGTFHGYAFYGCKCEPCTAANRERQAKRRKSDKARRAGSERQRGQVS